MRTPGQPLRILRFAHAFSGGAGLEYDIEAIHAALGAETEAEVDYLHLAETPERAGAEQESFGRLQVRHHRFFRPVRPPAASTVEPRHPSLPRRAAGALLGHRRLSDPLVRLLGRCWTPTHPETEVPAIVPVACGLLEQRRHDLLAIHSPGGRDALALLRRARELEIPTVIQLHFANDRYRDYSNRLQAALATAAAGVSAVAVPPYLRNRFFDLKTGLDTRRYPPLTEAERAARAAHPPQLICPGRIVPEKGQLDLVLAVARLREEGQPVHVVLPGREDDPEYVRRLRAEIHERNLSGLVSLPGLLRPAELNALYRQATALVLPTYHPEGCPRVVLEAMALGLPAIVYRSGGAAAAIRDGKNGFAVAPGDQAGLEARIRELLRNPDQAWKMGRAARQTVEADYSLPALANRHLGLYGRLLPDRGAVWR